MVRVRTEARPRAPVSRFRLSWTMCVQHRLLDHQLEALVLELADQAVEDVVLQDLHQRLGIQRLEGDEAREAGQQLGQEAVGLEVGHLLHLLGVEADGDGVGRLHGQRLAAEADAPVRGAPPRHLVEAGERARGDEGHVGGRHHHVVAVARVGELQRHHHLATPPASSAARAAPPGR